MEDPAEETLEVSVDMALCYSHGQCEVAAPEVFELNDEGQLEYDEHPPASQRARVEQAVRVCPVQAIRLKR